MAPWIHFLRLTGPVRLKKPFPRPPRGPSKPRNEYASYRHTRFGISARREGRKLKTNTISLGEPAFGAGVINKRGWLRKTRLRCAPQNRCKSLKSQEIHGNPGSLATPCQKSQDSWDSWFWSRKSRKVGFPRGVSQFAHKPFAPVTWPGPGHRGKGFVGEL